MSNQSSNPRRGRLLSIGTGLIGLLLGGVLGIAIALVVFFFGVLLIALLYFVGIFIPIDQISHAISFLQDISNYVIYTIFIGTALVGGIIGFTAGEIPAWLRRK
ncbi:MAG: hypothetical protein KDE51_17630 [Anaerolineales bacterium]|nr:hypothetical protein [Anaerolineales bacterium]